MDKGDDGGPFGRRYVIVTPLRVTGPVDLAVLQGALDDVVTRHELLRTLVVRDAGPAYQLVCPPCQVPLEVRDIPPVTDKSRDMVIQELILEVQAGPISARQVPLLRALLCRFDDRDSALFLTVHHSVCDGWSIQVLLRDLGAFYAARADGTRPKLAERQLAVNDSSRPRGPGHLRLEQLRQGDLRHIPRRIIPPRHQPPQLRRHQRQLRRPPRAPPGQFRSKRTGHGDPHFPYAGRLRG